MYLLTARIAWACNLVKACGEDGKEIVPPLYDYTAGFNAQPKWFPFDLSIRSQERLSIIEAEMEREAKSDPLQMSS